MLTYILQAATTPRGFKPPEQWGYRFAWTEKAVCGWADETNIVFPFDDALNAITKGTIQEITGRSSVSTEPTRHGDGIDNTTTGSTGPHVTYPSVSYVSAFDSPYAELTFVLWAIMGTGPTASGFRCVFDATLNNTNAWRVFSSTGSATARFRMPEGAGNLDVSTTGLWSAGDTVQWLCRKTHAEMKLNIYNWSTGSAVSGSVASAGTYTVGNDGFRFFNSLGSASDSVSMTALASLIDVTRAWTDGEMWDNRTDPFNFLRPNMVRAMQFVPMASAPSPPSGQVGFLWANQ